MDYVLKDPARPGGERGGILVATMEVGCAAAEGMVREIQRFVETAARSHRAELYVNRRSASRLHRSFPLLVARLDGPGHWPDYSVTMADVSSEGIGFYCDTGFPVGSVLGVKLFWSSPDAVRVPVTVCHNLVTPRGVLVGGRFATDDPAACALVGDWNPAWYG